MTFVNPLILAAGLAAIAIPIAIHLLMRRRRKPTPWAAMRFLQEAIRRRRRRLQLEKLLLLVVRCLLVAAIALALGRPMVRGLAGDTPFANAPVTLAIVIDDSIASGAPDAGPDLAGDAAETTALDRHKAMALDLLESLDAVRGDRAVLVPLSGPLASADDLPEASALAPTSDLGAIGRLVEQLTPTEAAADLPGALALVAAGARDADDGRGGPAGRGRWIVAVLADATAGVVGQDAGANPTPTRADADQGDDASITVLASDPTLLESGPAGDAGIAALTPVRPVLVVGQGEAVALSAPARVTVGRSGAGLDTESRVDVQLRFVDDTGPGAWAQASVRLRPGERTGSVVLEAPVAGRPRGLAYLQARLSPQAAAGGVPGNDSAIAAVTLRRQLTVAIVDTADPLGDGAAGGLDPEDPGAWLRTALAPEAIGDGDPLADIAALRLDPSVVDAPRLARADAAFVLAPGELRPGGWRALAGFARGGGLVVVFPDPHRALAPWAEDFTDAFGLPWSVGPEAAVHDTPRSLARGPGDDAMGVLRLIEGELERLLRPVTVSRHLPLAVSATTEATQEGGATTALLTLSDGTPAALAARPGGERQMDQANEAGTPGGGLVVLFAVPLSASWTDLPARPVIVPLVQELARAGVGVATGNGPARAGARPDAPAGGVQLRPGWIIGTDGRAGGSIAPVRIDERGRAARPLRRAGPWLSIDGTGRPTGLVAVAPAHAGADRDPKDRPALRDALAYGLGVGLADGDAAKNITWLDRPGGGGRTGAVSAAEAMAASEPSLALAAILLAAALALAALEVVLARQFSHAQVMSASVDRAAGAREAA